MSSSPVRPQLAHLGVYTDRQREMQAFYEAVLGLVVTDEGVAHKFNRRIVFMSSSPEQHHQFVLVQREAGDPPLGPVFQISFKVASLDELRQVRDRAVQRGARNVRQLNHGNSWSTYFDDLEGNMVEIYLDTPWYVAQPFAVELDLDRSDTEIRERTAELVRLAANASPASDWSAKMERRLQGAST